MIDSIHLLCNHAIRDSHLATEPIDLGNTLQIVLEGGHLQFVLTPNE